MQRPRTSGWPWQNSAIRVGPLEVGQHQDVEEFGAGGRPEGIQALL